MVLVDSRVGSKEILPHLRSLGVEAELAQLEAGDFCFYGNLPEGQVLVGVERKRFDGSSNDMLDSIHSGRYAGFQQHNMIAMYGLRLLIVEGVWGCSEEGHLMVRDYRGWRTIESKGRPTPYSSLFRFLLSVTFAAGTHWMQSGSPFETAVRVANCHEYFSKPWDEHHSQGAIHQMPIAQFSAPTFEQRVAAQIGGIGPKRSLAAANHFKTVPAMVRADEREWMKIDGIAGKTARRIVAEIQGFK